MGLIGMLKIEISNFYYKEAIMAKRQVFFSFHYGKDNWRAGMVRNMGKVDDSSMFSDNDWETVKKKSDPEIKKWINDQMQMRSCLVVLIGVETSGRKCISQFHPPF
jgi:hypothetical protein